MASDKAVYFGEHDDEVWSIEYDMRTYNIFFFSRYGKGGSWWAIWLDPLCWGQGPTNVGKRGIGTQGTDLVVGICSSTHQVVSPILLIVPCAIRKIRGGGRESEHIKMR